MDPMGIYFRIYTHGTSKYYNHAKLFRDAKGLVKIDNRTIGGFEHGLALSG